MMSSQYLLHVEQTFYFLFFYFLFFFSGRTSWVYSITNVLRIFPSSLLGKFKLQQETDERIIFFSLTLSLVHFWGRILELKFYFYPKDINLQSTKIVCSNSQASSHIVWALATMISMATPECWSLDLVSCIQLSCFTSSKTLLVSNANSTKRFFWPMISILGNCLQCWTLLQIW